MLGRGLLEDGRIVEAGVAADTATDEAAEMRSRHDVRRRIERVASAARLEQRPTAVVATGGHAADGQAEQRNRCSHAVELVSMTTKRLVPDSPPQA